MRIFGIQSDVNFVAFAHEPFQEGHTEETLHNWLESNPEGILEDKDLLIIGREVPTSLGAYIDLLGVDRAGDVVVVELKRAKTPRDTVAQALEYAAFAERLDADQLETIYRSYLNDDSLIFAEHHRRHFELGESEAVAFNKDQRIVIICQEISPQIKQTAQFLTSKGVSVTCVEFSFFRTKSGDRLMSQEIVVNGESPQTVQISSRSAPLVDLKGFLASCDENGKAVFSRMLKWSDLNDMKISWGTKGFSSSVILGGVRVPVAYGFPPNSLNKQSVYTAFGGAGNIRLKTAVPDKIIQSIKDKAVATGLYVPAGQDVKCLIDHKLTDNELLSILELCESIAAAIREHGLKR